MFAGWFASLGFPMCIYAFSPAQFDADRVAWTHLSFQAKNFWVEVSTDVELKRLPVSELDSLLLTSSKGNAIKPQTSEAAQMTIHTTIDPKFRTPVSIYNRIWFDPANASALGRIRLRRGEDDFKKMYRFTDQGVFRHRMEPKNKKEASRAPEQWTDIEDTFYDFDMDQLGCNGISERSVLIYIATVAAISESTDPVSLCVFGKRRLHNVQLKVAGKFPLKVYYTEKTQQKKVKQEKSLEAIKIAIQAKPMESNLKDPENFSFLGLHDDIAVYIDPASLIPVRVSGVISRVGKVNLKLREVWLEN
jgi:hypothetical protein